MTEKIVADSPSGSKSKQLIDRTTMILASILIGQVGLAVALKYNATTYGAFQANKPLISKDVEKATDIVIKQTKDGPANGTPPGAPGTPEAPATSGKKEVVELVLHKDGARWLIPKYHNFPASPDSIKRLMENLKKLKRNLPVATTADSAKRFKVTPDDFVRCVSLSEGTQPLTTMFIGTSPGFRKSNVRLDNETEIFAVEFSEHDVNSDPTDWIDREAAVIKGKDIAKVEMPDYTVELKNNKWYLTEKDGQSSEISYHVAEDVFEKLEALSISELLGDTAGGSTASAGAPPAAATPAAGAPAPATPAAGAPTAGTRSASGTTPANGAPATAPAGSYTFKITLRNGNVLTYTMTQPAGKNYYALKVTGPGSTLANYNLKVDSWYVDEFKKVTVKSLKEEWQAEQAHKKANAIPASLVKPKTDRPAQAK
jgi:hypothetical protein